MQNKSHLPVLLFALLLLGGCQKKTPEASHLGEDVTLQLDTPAPLNGTTLRAEVSGFTLLNAPMQEGTTSLKLPAGKAIPSLLMFSASNTCPGLDVQPQDLRLIAMVALGAFDAGGQLKGYYLRSTTDKLPIFGDPLQKDQNTVTYVYADKDGSMKGSCTRTSENGATFKDTYQLAYKKGWNAVFNHMVSDTETVLDNTPPEQSVPWRFRSL